MPLLQIEKRNTKIYDDFYRSEQLDGWDEVDKKLNFYYIFKIFDGHKIATKKPTILDVGCGTGDILKYLPVYKNYLGIDIYRPALKIAKICYKCEENISFCYGNILSTKIKSKSFDFVLSSGALSMNLNALSDKKFKSSSISHPNYEFLKTAVINMNKIAKLGISFNVLIKNSYTKSDGKLFYYEKDHVLEICKNINDNINYEYNPMDRINPQITVYLRK